MVNLLPTIRLANRFGNANFPPQISPSKRAFEIYMPRGLFSELYRIFLYRIFLFLYRIFPFNFGQNKLKPSQQNKTLIVAGFFLFSVEFLIIGRGWGGGEMSSPSTSSLSGYYKYHKYQDLLLQNTHQKVPSHYYWTIIIFGTIFPFPFTLGLPKSYSRIPSSVIAYTNIK